MRFADEDEVDEWYRLEKDKLDEAFMNAIEGRMDSEPKERAKYEAHLKALIAKYQDECNRVISRKK